MTPEPLTPADVDSLLAPDPRTRSADLLVLRDALMRMSGALERLADAVERLEGPDAPPRTPPRAD